MKAPERDAAIIVEVAAEAGLAGTRADADGNPVWVPTDEFDRWRDLFRQAPAPIALNTCETLSCGISGRSRARRPPPHARSNRLPIVLSA